jgi:ATP-dependent exoDNAse (exonuclease V) alpha subunit
MEPKKMIQLDFKIGDKVKITENIYSVEGTLYKGSVVEIEEMGFPDKDLRVSDNVGRIWYLNFYDIEKMNG